ncbi:hypothetical protein M8494_11645 [Serratia ureilytica]
MITDAIGNYPRCFDDDEAAERTGGQRRAAPDVRMRAACAKWRYKPPKASGRWRATVTMSRPTDDGEQTRAR